MNKYISKVTTEVWTTLIKKVKKFDTVIQRLKRYCYTKHYRYII